MKTRMTKTNSYLALAALLLSVWCADGAMAQYGSQPMGRVFSGPATAPSGAPSHAAEDPYNPNVWLAQRGPRWNRRAALAQNTSDPSVVRDGNVEYESSAPIEGEVVPAPHGPVHEGPIYEGPIYEGHGYHGDGCAECGGHGYDNCGTCRPCMPCPSIEFIDIYAGVQGFKGPTDFPLNSSTPVANGDFGFHEGFNLALPLPCYDLVGQVGFQAVQSQLEGSTAGTETRNQFFFTAGGFHREVSGIQYGVAFDWLNDTYGALAESADLYQLRGEISLVNAKRHEIGFWTAIGFDSAEDDIFQALDQYNLFYRLATPRGGDARIWVGLTGEGDGLFGFDTYMPISERVSSMVTVNYLIPDGVNASDSQVRESWNISLSLVYHLRCRPGCYNPYRPLFNVANNGTFFQHRRPN